MAEPNDDTCELLEYAENVADWVISPVKRQLTRAVSCLSTPSYPADLLSDRRFYHDGQDRLGEPAHRWRCVRSGRASSWSGGAVYVTASRTERDLHGRAVKQFDALNHLTQTAYACPERPVTTTVVTNPLGFKTTTTTNRCEVAC